MSRDLSGAFERLAALREWREPTPDGGLSRVREVVVLASSSRGGSSMLQELLRRSPHLVNLQAEFNPFLAIAGLAWPDSGSDSDRLGPEHAALAPAVRAAFERELLLDATVGGAVPALDDEVRERLVHDLCWRLVAQWPHEDFDLALLRATVRRTLAELPAPLDPVAMHLHVLRQLRPAHPGLDPWLSDVAAGPVARVFPGEGPPHGPPVGPVLEEPPFVFVRPRRRPSPAQLSTLPLVLKAPSNAYRLPFLRALFPGARLRVLHLTRNPAASINGLVDGWLYRGFHAHLLDQPLSIAGYADQRPQDARWWKYDLPPGWQDWTARSLVEVCGLQWRGTHGHVLADLDAHPDTDVHRVRFEDVLADLPRRMATFEALCAWLGIPLDGPLLDGVLTGLPPIMSTTPPRKRRWFARAAQLDPVLADPAVRSVAERLGYDDPDSWT